MKALAKLGGLLVAVALCPVEGLAQDWATRDVCQVSEAEIDSRALTSDALQNLRQDAAAIANPNGRFWRIQSPNGAVSHLWGTMHANDPMILDLPPIVISRIDSARLIAPEADFIAPTRQQHREQLALEDWYRDPGTRYEFDRSGLPADVIEWIRQRTDGLGWGSDAADYLTFGGLAELVLTDPCSDFAAGTLPDQDSRIQMLGMIGGAEVLGLEDADDFTTHLNRSENAATALAILAMGGAYLQPQSNAARRKTSFALYLQGEIAVSMLWDRALLTEYYGADLAQAYLAMADGYLLKDRNRRFLEAALPELHEGRVFMALGSFHLPGETGMIELLRNRGFIVTRIPLPGETPDR